MRNKWKKSRRRPLSRRLLIGPRLKRNTGVGAELLIVAEIDHIPTAIAGAALATERLGMYRQQKFAVADEYEVVIHCGLHRIELKRSRHIPRGKFDAQDARVLFVDPHDPRVLRHV